jgi:lipoprotein-anchoring transpeptidase ErfK/SrfK
MPRRRSTAVGAILAIVAVSMVPALGASATTALRVTSSVPSALSSALPLARLHFSHTINASHLPPLVTSPQVATRWEQIGAQDVEALAVGHLIPSMRIALRLPTQVRCAAQCTFAALRTHVATVGSSLTLEDQLLAELHYLPVAFTPTTTSSDPTQSASGVFSWSDPALPTALQSMWSVGTANTVLTGALMHFQQVHNLATTGVADAYTWSSLERAVTDHVVDPTPYDYVFVTQSSPETLTLYVNGHVKYRTLVNTGISVSPTAVGTFPVYLRYTTTTMSGTNPDGSHYSDPGIPWVSYFHGGDALHGYIRATYGWPQSLGCVEMPYANAGVVWPWTPIGTLVTVSA